MSFLFPQFGFQIVSPELLIVAHVLDLGKTHYYQLKTKSLKYV